MDLRRPTGPAAGSRPAARPVRPSQRPAALDARLEPLHQPLPDAIYLALHPGADREAITAAANTWGVEITSTDAYLSTLDAEFVRLTRLALRAIVGAALAYTGVAVANTQLMATTGRAGDLATLRLAGATTGQIRRTIASEALLTSAAGVILGAAVNKVLRAPSGGDVAKVEWYSLGQPRSLNSPATVCLALVSSLLLLVSWRLKRPRVVAPAERGIAGCSRLDLK